ncbi:hypothetical protein PC117_g12615 [Phytophthora cactorum]|uniref:RxLR effector protein n=1 Tax=Phytophthora cactorum TaxID=29920 RepID=A0A8T1D8X1_9STRA|nr:hypothetical protein PC117_g12615 [Phytophthora cactorum]
MRLTYVLVLLEAAVIATLYATDASDVTLSGLNMANAVVLANDQENFGNHRRFLRTYKEDVATADDEDDHDQDKKNDDEEERMFSGWKDKLKAAGTIVFDSAGNTFFKLRNTNGNLQKIATLIQLAFLLPPRQSVNHRRDGAMDPLLLVLADWLAVPVRFFRLLV